MSINGQDVALLQTVANKVSAIDERTKMTHELVTAHIERNDQAHDHMHSRINRLARTVHVTAGGLTLVAGVGVAWIKGLFTTGS